MRTVFQLRFFVAIIDIDSYAIELLKPSCSNGASEFNNIKLVLDKSSFHQDKTASDVRSTKEGGNNRNSVVLNIEMYKELPGPSSSSETKTNSRPQRQAAKKAESQIRVNQFKPLSYSIQYLV